jgi:hypothetical protein
VAREYEASQFWEPEIVYRVSQKERPILWEVIVSAILRKKCIYTRVLFRTVSEVQLFHYTVAKLLIRKRYYVMFLIPVFIVQVTKLVQFIWCKIPPQLQCTLQLMWGHGVLLVCTVKQLYLGNRSEQDTCTYTYTDIW